METHTNGHGKTSSRIAPAKSVPQAKKKVGSFARQAKSQALDLVHEGESRVNEAAREATSFIKRHPKTAIALALGAGIAIGALANGKFGRAAFVGLIGLVADRFA